MEDSKTIGRPTHKVMTPLKRAGILLALEDIMTIIMGNISQKMIFIESTLGMILQTQKTSGRSRK